MGIEDIFNWYQQKIGTYDRQQWETKLEQQRFFGFKHVQTRSTKPNTDLIDLDLVRGSTFPKAKPQHGFITVAKLASFRIFLLPLHEKWWKQQTSSHAYNFLLGLYLAQLVNLIIYFILASRNVECSCLEMVIPFVMMWILSLIHSQIVSTNHGNDGKTTKKLERKIRTRRLVEEVDKDADNKPVSLNTKHLCKFGMGNRLRLKKRHHIDDDGFESYNGNGSRTSDDDQLKSNKESLNVKTEEFLVQNTRKKRNVRFKTNKKEDIFSTDSDSERGSLRKKNRFIPQINVTPSVDSEDESEEDIMSSPRGDVTSSATEWLGGTTNSEDFSSDLDGGVSDGTLEQKNSDNDLAANTILNHSNSKVTCTLWERNEIKKADLTMLDISLAIIGKVDLMPESRDYFYIGIIISTILAMLPIFCRFCNCNNQPESTTEDLYRNLTKFYEVLGGQHGFMDLWQAVLQEFPGVLQNVATVALGSSFWEITFMVIVLFQRWILSLMVFFLLAVAERTFKQRLLYAKLFSHLTSSRRARKSELPHFRLNKVRNIKTWLSVRSYLKKRGPQRSVDVIVSTAFIIALLLITFLCVELLKETVSFSQYYLEALIWCLGLGILLLRFMTLGTNINKKYRNLSVLITEQINLHLQIEQKPHKKNELTVANNVLKLAIDLLKELENPFKISGLSANPILYNITKLIILSALSGVLSEMLGFKLKLHKIKLK